VWIALRRETKVAGRERGLPAGRFDPYPEDWRKIMSQYTAPTNLGQAPHALAAWLLEANYTAHCRERIVEHVTCHGTLAGLVEIELLDAEDYPTAEAVFVESLPSVAQADRAWEDDREWTLPDAELEAIDAEDFAEECDERDAPDPWPTDEEIAEFDADEEHRAAFEWFDRRESFGDWLEANGGPVVG
jgi:hypothetical protein